VHVVKGHGTENDFVVLPDLNGTVDLTTELTRRLCDRRAGIGADGVLRVVRSEHDDVAKGLADEAPYFMDYRNADGSLAEMCGNGIRVFARYLRREGLIDAATAIVTRGGVRRIWFDDADDVTVDMGTPALLAVRPRVTVGPLRDVSGRALQMPNPHVVVAVDSPDTLRALDLSAPPVVDPALPTGQNVEFVVRHGARHLAMRVHERGVGETRSCGTGICAAAVATAALDPAAARDGSTWRVDVPGGTCSVSWRADDTVWLHGPAVLVADLDLAEDWLRGA
jgi:diaminopimelate epimerase